MTSFQVLQPGDTLQGGRYSIGAPVGEGAFAKVYRAQDRRMMRTVAIKVLNRQAPGIGSTDIHDYRQRFVLEAQLGGHPAGVDYLIPVYNWFEDGEHLALVMAYASGGSLKDRLEKGGCIPWSEALGYVKDAAQGLHVLHEEVGAIHRDIKPSNLMIDANGRLRIADLGLAQIESDLTRRSELGSLAGPHPGTPAYRSPEHNNWEPLGPTSDVYCLGCVAFELLTGQTWKKGRRKAMHVRDLQPDVPRWLDRVVMRMLAEVPALNAEDAKDTNLRYVDMPSLLADLEPRSSLPSWLAVVLTVASLAALAGCLVASGLLLRSCGEEVPTSTPKPPVTSIVASPTVGATPSSAPTEPPVVSSSPTPTVVSAETLLPDGTRLPPVELGVTRVREVDDMQMVYVPSGSFSMGSVNGEDDQRPVHTVTLDGFWLDQFEVTNQQYARFLNVNGNQVEGALPWIEVPNDYAMIEVVGEHFVPKIGYADHPVVEVSWYGAVAYCRWVDGRLPTESEWEYAARGPSSLIYPWGDHWDVGVANCSEDYCRDGYETTAPVGTFPDGASWVGALDLLGNAWEWVHDWYDPDYYRSAPERNPMGPTSGSARVMRGGSYYPEWDLLPAALRNSNGPDSRDFASIGFRCAMSQ